MSTKITLTVLLAVLAFLIGHWIGYKAGQKDTVNALFSYFYQNSKAGKTLDYNDPNLYWGRLKNE